jgi:hypothetical protein
VFANAGTGDCRETNVSDEQAVAARPSLFNGILILILIVAGIVAWIALGGAVLAVKSFFASFLFVWYWANVEKLAFNRLPASVIGAMAGVGLAWALKMLPVLYPAWGLAAAIALIVITLFFDVMKWLPLITNASALLFLTILAAPAILSNLDLVEMTKAIVGGAAFFMVLVYGATLYAKMTAARVG